MKFICLGYYDESKWEAMTESEQQALIERCFAYDDELRRGNHILGGEALQSPKHAVTIRWQNGKAAVTDGPYAETKEQIGGLLVLEARDLNHAIALISRHPGVRTGPFEIRPADEKINALFEDRQKSTQRG